MKEILIGLMTYCAVPVTAWCFYKRLYDRMEARGITEPPTVQFFLIFTAYAGWLMVLFILLSGAWSDMMFLVLVYLLLVAPILMLGAAISLITKYRQSSYHTGAFVASGIYFSLFAMLLLMSMMVFVVNI